MKRLARCLLLLAVFAAAPVYAAGVVHVANGDCAGLSAAASAAPGQEPGLIVLARGGNYFTCAFKIAGKIVIDGAGATLQPVSGGSQTYGPMIQIEAGASLSLRNAVIGYTPNPTQAAAATKGSGPKFCCAVLNSAVINSGSLTLDAVTITRNYYVSGIDAFALGLIQNSGSLVMRNVSVVGNTQSSNWAPALLSTSGPVEISHSTFVTTPQNDATALLEVDNGGSIALANSIVVNNGAAPAPACVNNGGSIVSRGGNVFGDASCGTSGAKDRIAADVRALDFGTHGGVVPTLALDYDSPALNNGVLANCEATDARGLARSTASCDSGALEVGAGSGNLSASGMSGLYYNAANNGHYVTVQRLYGDNALVIWNTFDEHGVPAWLYGVGTVANGHVHVAQVAQNVGGKLQAGGGVSGATPTLWGSFDLNVSDCYNAALSYSSPNTAFGNGSTSLQRLAFVDGLDCQR